MKKSDFVDWKRHPVTQEVFSQLIARKEEIKDRLAYNAGKDSIEDSRLVGAILALDELLGIEYVEESHGN